MTDPMVDTLITRLREHRGRYRDIADRSGMSYSLVQKIARRHRTNPTIGTIRRLHEAMDAMAASDAASDASEAGTAPARSEVA